MNPEKMTVIGNIQRMQEIINGKPEWNRLQSLTITELRAEQDALIPKYNQAIKSRQDGNK